MVALLEDIRRHVMSSNMLKIKEMHNATGLITPKARAVMEKRKKNLKWCYPLASGRDGMRWTTGEISIACTFEVLFLVLAGRMM